MWARRSGAPASAEVSHSKSWRGRTKISVRLLRAMENNAFDVLPPGIFIRGFLRAYAREVGLDPAHGRKLSRAVRPLEPVTRSTAAGREEDGPACGRRSCVKRVRHRTICLSETGSEAWKAIAIALVSLGFVAYLSLGTARDAVAADPGAPADIAPAVLSVTKPACFTPPMARPVATAGKTFDIAIHATGPCWVEAMVDGNRRVYDLMGAGIAKPSPFTRISRCAWATRRRSPSRSTGGQDACTGRAGQPVTIRIDAENFSDFLSS